ncbi:zinc ribbon domain-containing protein [Nonomuraea turkmeniaca]|uniref:zinc ribbon domain-containing protein n=1 Tax=Nonomuraea turkmeniaca TaxID=103838 RepID=UPI0026A2EBA4
MAVATATGALLAAGTLAAPASATPEGLDRPALQQSLDADYIAPAFPSLLEGSTKSLDDHRFRTIAPEELVKLGLNGTPTGEPGVAPGSYSNTNYILAGLRHTSFPRTPHIPGPHSKAFESMYGLIDPPPSSKLCSVCGTLAEQMPLAVRKWDCSCGAHHDRDVNAAINILAAGQAERRNACGGQVRPSLAVAQADEAGSRGSAAA